MSKARNQKTSANQPAEVFQIELISNKGDKRLFRIDEAQAILDHDKRKKLNLWSLPEDSIHTLENGKLIKRGGNKTNQNPAVRSGVEESEG